jgi:ribosome-associated translation inhibitor RaiA
VKNVSAADLQKEFELSMKIRDANNRLHIAVNQIRQLRGELETLRKWAGDGQQAQVVVSAARQFEAKMTPIEEELIQVKMKSSEATLAFPGKLNEELDALSHTEDSADSAPTAQMYQVFDMLNRRLEEQLARCQEVLNKDLPSLNQLMRANAVPALQAPSGIPTEY